MRPSFGVSRRLMQRRNVLLPDPLAPRIAITSPLAAVTDTPLSTSTEPNCFLMPSTARAGGFWLILFPAFRYRPSVDLRLLSRGVSSQDAAGAPKMAR